MFRNWGFLLGEIWVLLLLAALLGLFVGWLIWGRRETVVNSLGNDEATRLRAALTDCEGKSRAQAGRLATLERELADAAAREDASRAALVSTAAPVMAAPAATAAAPVAVPVAVPVTPAPVSFMAAPADAAPVMEKSKPATLTAARDGKPDDLKLIKGVGPKLAALCNKLGFYHFDQIAAWTDAEIAWVDENLEGFKGRVVRDEWVVQARDLAAGKPPRAGGEN